MAEAPEAEPVSSGVPDEGSVPSVALEVKEDEEPLAKKRKTDTTSDTAQSDKLENRLGGILCCAVCLDLPLAAVYQCSNGHLMCAPCFTHLLADARLRDESASCPNCRVEISKATASRNLAVEKTVSELPSECKNCSRVFPRHSLQAHEEQNCEEREYKFAQLTVDASRKARLFDGLVRIVASVYSLLLSALRRTYLVSELTSAPAKRRRYRRLTGCRYACIGCPWRGPAHEARSHEATCAHPSRSAADVLESLAERDRRSTEAHHLYTQILDLLSYEKITFNDLQMKPYRTEEFVHKLYYETSRFVAFGHQWLVKAFVNKHQRDPTQSAQREITYQLMLKSKTACPLSVQWVWVRGPYGEAHLRPAVCAHAFRDDEAAPSRALPLADTADTNRLLANKAIHFRLIMFLSMK